MLPAHTHLAWVESVVVPHRHGVVTCPKIAPACPKEGQLCTNTRQIKPLPIFAFFIFVPISTIPLGWQQVEEVFLPLHHIPMYVPKTHHASSINVQHLTGG